MTCKNCNAPLEARARFCVKCGAPVVDAQESQPSAPEPQEIGRTEIQPRRVEHPIRPPRRPTPATPRGSGNEIQEERNSEYEHPLAAPPPDDISNQATRSDVTTPGNIHEQPLATLSPATPEGYGSVPTARNTNTLYEQPTMIVKRASGTDDGKAAPITPYDVPTFPFSIQSVSHPELTEAEHREQTQEVPPPIPTALSSSELPQPLLYYRLNTTTKGSQKLPAVVNRQAYVRRRRRRGAGCFLGCLTTLIILLLVVGVAWVFALRPYAHSIAQGELDNALASAVNQIPPQASLLPPRSIVPANENSINNLVVLNLAPSDPIQHPTTTISQQNIRLDFQLYNLPCTVTTVPTLDNGRLVVKNTSVEGIFSAVMSPDEMTSILNKHLSDAQTRLNRTITNVQLKDHEVDLTLG